MGESLVDLSKSWKGEEGDKRNTKYALAGYAGLAAGSASVGLSPKARRIVSAGINRGNRAMSQMPVDGSVPVRDMIRNSQKAMWSTPGIKRLAVVRGGAAAAGAAAGVGGYAAYRKKKREGVEKALPAVGALKPLGSSFMRGVKGRKMTAPKKPTGVFPTAGQMRANQAGLLVNRYRTPLTAVAAGGAAGGAAGYMAGRKDDD